MPRLTLSSITPPALYLFFALFCLIFSACSVGDFVGAYFNTYYNAQKAFGEAEDEVWSQPDLKLQGAGKNYLAQFNASQNTKTKFSSVIEKCSKLLEYHPDSKLVDDALMMIGKSYFYQNDYQPAERKFKELITGYPESGLLLEAKMLMAYSFYKEGDKATAATTAAEVLDAAKKDGDDNIVAYTAILLAQMDLEDKNYSLALEHYRDAASSADSREQRAFAYLNAAEMYIKIGDYVQAEDAYREATRQSPNYLGEYKGEIGAARMLAKQKKFDESLEMLRELRADMNNKEFFGEIELEMANCYRDEGNLSMAVEQYRYVDTAYARTEWSANSYYELGLLYETQVGLYDSARVAYVKGRSEAGTTTKVAPLLTRRADYMSKYVGYASEIRTMDSLRVYWLTRPDSTKISPDSMKVSPDSTRVSADSTRVSPDSTRVSPDSAAQDTSRRKNVALADSAKPKAPVKPALPLDSVVTRLATAKSELATLFYTSIGRTDSALYWYNRLIQDHPLSSLVPRALFSIAQIYSQDSTKSKSVVDSLYRQLMDQYPQSLYANEARRALGMPPVAASPDSAEALYHQAEQAMLSGRNKDAIDTLRLITHTYPSSTYAPRAQYAAGWLYEQVLNVPDSAIANYQRLRARYPSSLYAARVQPKLMEVELRNKAVADSLAQKHKALQDSLAQKHKVAPDSLGQSHKAAVDSLGQNHKASVDSLLQKDQALTDSTAQKQNSRPDLKRRRMMEDDTPVNRRSQQPPADRDSTLVPEGPPADTTQTRRDLPPISNPEDRD